MSGQAGTAAEDIGADVDLSRLADAIPDAGDLMDTEDDAPIIRLINAILSQAVREQAGQMVLKNIDNADFSGFTSTIYGRRMNAASAWRSSL